MEDATEILPESPKTERSPSPLRAPIQETVAEPPPEVDKKRQSKLDNLAKARAAKAAKKELQDAEKKKQEAALKKQLKAQEKEKKRIEKEMKAQEKANMKYMAKETRAELDQARRLRDINEARQLEQNAIVERRVAQELGKIERFKLRQAAKVIQTYIPDSDSDDEARPKTGQSEPTPDPVPQPVPQVVPQRQAPRWSQDPYMQSMLARLR